MLCIVGGERTFYELWEMHIGDSSVRLIQLVEVALYILVVWICCFHYVHIWILPQQCFCWVWKLQRWNRNTLQMLLAPVKVFALSHLCPKWQSAKHNWVPLRVLECFNIRDEKKLNWDQLALFQGLFQHELAKTWSFGPRTHCDLGCYFVPDSSTTSMTHPTTKWPSTVNACWAQGVPNKA